MTGIFAIRALHPTRIFEKISTKCAPHDVVKLLLHKFVAVLFMDFFFPLSNGALPAKTDIEGLLILVIFCCRLC